MAGLILLAVVLRLGLLIAGPATDHARALYPDSNRYIHLGENLARTGTFGLADEQVTGLVHVPLAEFRAERGEREPLNAHGLRPEIVRTPGYPLMIAGLRRVGGPWVAVLLVQCILGALNVWLVYLIGRRVLASPVGAVMAAGIIAVHPACIVFANAFLSETLFVTFMLGGIWLSLRSLDRGAPSAASGGLLLGLSVLVRPIGIVIGPAIGLWMAITQRQTRPAIVLIFCSLAPAAGWMGRNHHHGSGMRLSSIANLNAWFYTAAHMDIADGGGDLYHDWPEAVAVQHARLRQRIGDRESTFAAMKRLAVARIKADPAMYAALLARSAGKMMTDHSAPKLYHALGAAYEPTGARAHLLAGRWDRIDRSQAGQLAVAGAWSAFNALLVLLMLVGLVRLLIARRWATLALLAGLLAYFVFATQTNGLERFHLPIIGLQAITVAATFIRLRPRPAARAAPRVPPDPFFGPAPGRPVAGSAMGPTPAG